MSLQILQRQLPDRFMILPDLHYFFGEVRNQEYLHDVMVECNYAGIAKVRLTRLGGIALTFLPTGPLASIVQYKTKGGGGSIPEHVMQNHDDIVDLQGRRLNFANFIAAALFGRLGPLRHSSMQEPRYVGMDRILGFNAHGTRLEIEPTTAQQEIVEPKVKAAENSFNATQIVKPEELAKLMEFLQLLAVRQEEFVKAGLQSCMLMNYQAAILHREQQAGASIVLNCSVAEALIEEIFHAYGLVGESKPKTFATRSHSVTWLSANAFRSLGSGDRIMRLAEGGFFNEYFASLFNEARIIRNDLVHRVEPVAVRQAGKLQAVVRELWTILLGVPFELLSAWGMRI
jgi:hypothetical protein